jgi:hypothetical protein
MPAYIEEEEKAERLAMPKQRSVMVSSSWSSSGREEIMRILWQRRVVPKVMTFGCYPELKL